MSRNRVALNDDQMAFVSGGDLVWDHKLSRVSIMPTLKNPISKMYSFEGYTYDEIIDYVCLNTDDYSDEGVLKCLIDGNKIKEVKF